jgi:hypothetical protein
MTAQRSETNESIDAYLNNMALTRLLSIVAFSMISSLASFAQMAAAPGHEKPELDFHAHATDPYASAIREDANESLKAIQLFFGAQFPDQVHFHLVSERADFDVAVKRFGLSPSQCWMVGVGTADLMVLLSPSAWAKQACEHDPNDSGATRQLVAHELIHVYHGQFNPTRDFSGVDDLDWFVEGLAVFGSGQLTKERLDRMQAAVDSNQIPSTLSTIWTGPNRYAFAGSLVRYVDQTWGRATIVRLLQVRSSKEALEVLRTDEKSLLGGWQASLAQKKSSMKR